MTRDVEMELSLWEMLLSVKRHIAAVLVTMIVCALLGGGFGYWRISRSQNTAEEAVNELEVEPNADHEQVVKDFYLQNQELAKDAEEKSVQRAEELRKEYDRLDQLSKDHPFANQDPADTERVSLTVSFDPAGGNHEGMLSDWIREADANELFGSEKERLEPYQSDLVYSGSGGANSCEAGVTIVAVDGMNPDRIVTYLKSYIKEKASQAGIKVLGFSMSKIKTFFGTIISWRNDIASQMSDIRSSLYDLYESVAATPAPAPSFEPAETKATTTEPAGVPLTSLMKYALVGLALGLFAGAALAIFLTLKEGCLISRRQVEDTFGLELLSDCSKDGAAALDILNANLDIMIGDESKVMLLGSTPDDEIEKLVSGWNSDGGREYVAGRDIIDDSETIDALGGVEGILLGIRIGKSKLTDVQRLMIRAHKLDKKILGYISL